MVTIGQINVIKSIKSQPSDFITGNRGECNRNNPNIFRWKKYVQQQSPKYSLKINETMLRV